MKKLTFPELCDNYWTLAVFPSVSHNVNESILGKVHEDQACTTQKRMKRLLTNGPQGDPAVYAPRWMKRDGVSLCPKHRAGRSVRPSGRQICLFLANDFNWEKNKILFSELASHLSFLNRLGYVRFSLLRSSAMKWKVYSRNILSHGYKFLQQRNPSDAECPPRWVQTAVSARRPLEPAQGCRKDGLC